MKTPKTGFTIIELLVVIAIIAVLAAIVLVNITGYINRGKDAAAKGDLATMMTNAATFYTANSTFDGVASDTAYDSAYDALVASSMGYTVRVTCDKSDTCAVGQGSTAWCACIKELAPSTATYYCVDSGGAKIEQTARDCQSECVLGVCQQ
jgi:prepilin-type N-terminal cleavage/methylation domain-containing protein